METIVGFIQTHKPYFDAVSAISSMVTLLCWGFGSVLLWNAWRRQGIRSVTVGPHNDHIPFLIFAGSDTPEFRLEAQQRGAQLSTNDMIELTDKVVTELGERHR